MDGLFLGGFTAYPYVHYTRPTTVLKGYLQNVAEGGREGGGRESESCTPTRKQSGGGEREHLPESGVQGPGYRGDLDNPPTDLATIVSDLVESWFVQLILTVTFALQSE